MLSPSHSFFFILVIIIVIMLAIMADDNHIALVLAVIGAMMWCSAHGYNMTYTRMMDATSSADKPADAPANETTETETEQKDENPNLRYGVSQREYDAYITSFGKCYPVKPVTVNGTDIDNSMDSNMAVIAQKRARDKRAIDGAVVKDANFYRHHFADELDQTEKRVWWGESEF